MKKSKLTIMLYEGHRLYGAITGQFHENSKFYENTGSKQTYKPQGDHLGGWAVVTLEHDDSFDENYFNHRDENNNTKYLVDVESFLTDGVLAKLNSSQWQEIMITMDDIMDNPAYQEAE